MQGCYRAGADPELMLMDVEGNLASAIGKIKGTKLRPRRVECGAIQRDNVLSEFNISPAATSEEMIHNIKRVLQQLAEVAHPLTLVPRAGADYPQQLLRNREACKFGCEPDYNAWPDQHGMVSINIIPGHAAALPFRSAGGHLHLGYTDATRSLLLNDFGKMAVVQMLDLFAGLFEVVVNDDPSCLTRRQLYGRAGAHRPKPYGVEYRALSNFWLRSPQLVEHIYQLADVAVRQVLENRHSVLTEIAGGGPTIQAIINEHNVAVARDVLDREGIRELIPGHIRALLEVEKPMLLAAPQDFYTSWELPYA